MAEEIAKIYEENVKSLKKQVKEERERQKGEHELIIATLMRENERDMMQAEEVVSRYSQMKHTLEEALDEKVINTDKINNYDNMKIMLATVTSQRDQVIKELNDAKDMIDKLEMQLTDKDAEIENIKEGHQEDLKTQIQEHNIEINALEQKIQQERIALASFKTESLKKQREEQSKISELQRNIKKLEQSAASNSPLKKGPNGRSPPQKN